MKGARPLLVGAGSAALAVAVESLALIDGGLRPVAAAIDVLIALSFVVAGTYAWWRHPANRTGVLMVAVGVLWALQSLLFTERVPALHTVGLMALGGFAAPLAHLLLAFPTGRLRERRDRYTVVAIYIHLTVQWWLVLTFFDGRKQRCDGCAPDLNLLAVWPDETVYDRLWLVHSAVSAVAAVVVFALLLTRWRRASRPLRRALNPVLATGLVAAAVISATAPVAFSLPQTSSAPDAINLLWGVTLSAVPVGFVVGLLRTRMALAGVARLVADLNRPLSPRALRDALARALGDPTLEVGLAVRHTDLFRDVDGELLRLPEPDDGRTVTWLEREGTPYAVLLHDPALAHQDELVLAAGQAAGLALDNARLQREVQAVSSRLVDTADAARRGIERDLHDGAQQSLVAMSLALRMLRDDGGVDGELLDSTARLADRALEQLRELARGVYPVELREAGLAAALRSLVLTASLPVELHDELPARPAPAAEAAAYFLCSEALANAAKHARARRARITLAMPDDSLLVTVEDDGVGGADPTRGTGLLGLADRVAAIGGRLTVESPPGAGTRITARIPCSAQSDRVGDTAEGETPLAAHELGR